MPAPTPFSPAAGVTSFPNEWSMLVECASPSREPLRLAVLARSVDWARVVVLAEEHGVIGHLAASLHDFGDSVPQQTKQALRDRQRGQVFLALRLTAELFRLLDLFDSEKIAAVAVKGPALSVRAYGDSSVRCYGDLDFLVRQRDIRPATELMMATGYQPAVPLSAIDAGKIPGQYLFSKADSKLLVELHNDCTLRYFPRPLPLEEFFARRTWVPIDAREAPALAVEDELVLICIHGAKHFWERLMWVADVAALVSRQANIDWKRAAASAEAVGAERMLHAGLRLAADLLRAHLPEEFSAALQGDVAAAKLAEQVLRWLPAAGNDPPGLLERAVFRLDMRGGLLAAPAYLLRLAFSPTEEDWTEEKQGGRSWLLEALRRPFRLARKYRRDAKS